jgi:Flp pilus assembly protein TadG
MTRRGQRQPRGQSLVEVALAFPVLVLLLMGLLDLGRAYYGLVTLNDAAAEGAAYAATYQDPAAIQLRVQAAEATTLLAMDEVVVDVSSGPYSVGSGVTVTATYQMQIYTPFVSGLVGSDSMTLRGSATQPVISLGN